MKRRAFEVSANQQTTLGEFLSQSLARPVTEIEALVEAGAVYVQGKRCADPLRMLWAGQKVMVVLEESGQSPTEPEVSVLQPRIVHQDDALLVVEKPAGIAAQPTLSRRGGDLWSWANDAAGRSVGLVHRLDKETSGVVLFGMTPAATSILSAQFRESTVAKTYLAVTASGLPAEGTVDLKISKDPSRPGRYRASKTANGQTALTRYRRIQNGDDFNWVALFPQTGRTHQLRAHLTALGFPIAGDRIYGGAAQLGGILAPRCLLHAWAIGFEHPASGEKVRFEVGVPEDMAAFGVPALDELSAPVA